MTGGLVAGDDGVLRCWWGDAPPIYRTYHDGEWGMPVADDAQLFEKLSLEGFQSGLSWLTILRKREAFRNAFAGFDPSLVARFGDADTARLLADAAIVRNRAKIEAVVGNARRALQLIEEAGSLAAYIWRFEPAVGGAAPADARVDAGRALAADLRRRGWRFVGPTTVYAFMQAMGLVNDHLAGCAAHARVERARAAFLRPG